MGRRSMGRRGRSTHYWAKLRVNHRRLYGGGERRNGLGRGTRGSIVAGEDHLIYVKLDLVKIGSSPVKFGISYSIQLCFSL